MEQTVRKIFAAVLALAVSGGAARAQLVAMEWYVATSANVPVDTRTSFGGRLARAVEALGSPDGETATNWDTTAISDGWRTLTNGSDAVDVAVLNSTSVSVEGGRLQANTTWASNTVHLLRHKVVIPANVTLTVNAGTVVKFTENAGIVVEDGGTLKTLDDATNNVWFAVAEDDGIGGDTDMRSASPVSGVSVYKFPSGKITENGYVALRDVSMSGYGSISLNDAQAAEASGAAYVAVTVSGTRNAPFSVDWVAEDGTAKFGADYTLASGTLSWTGTAEGTKYIAVPLVRDSVTEGFETFKVRIVTSRGMNAAVDMAMVTVFDSDVALHQENWTQGIARVVRVDTRTSFGGRLAHAVEVLGAPDGSSATNWNTTAVSDGWQTLTNGTETAEMVVLNNALIAIEGGRLLSNTTWTSNVLHLVRNKVVIPANVTLTVNAGTVVKFTENTGFIVEDGGTLKILDNATNNVSLALAEDDRIGGDTDMRDASPVSDVSVYKFPSGTIRENGYVALSGVSVSGYGSVSLNDAQAAEASGAAYVAVMVSGTRNAPFSMDWVAEGGTAKFGEDYTLASGTLLWTGTSEGTKYIAVPLVRDFVTEGFESFTVRIVASRGMNAARAAATVTVFDSAVFFQGGGLELVASQPSARVKASARTDFAGRIAGDQESLTYACAWTNPAAAKIRLTAQRRDEAAPTALFTSAASGEGAYAWDTSALPEGRYTLTHQFLDATGAQAGALTAQLYVARSILLHGGTLTTNEVWRSGPVHIVLETVIVPSGVTLTIESGAIVKFAPGAGIQVLSGGLLIARGVRFTHVADDTVGGDTNLDGGETKPAVNAYTVTGNVLTDEATEFGYTSQTTSGTLTGVNTWLARRVYHVTGDVTIPSGATLTIQPGAIVKFAAGKSLIVNSGGTLKAIGTRAQPIIFTSYRDDTYGGDTNGDGDNTAPQPGDWHQIKAAGGTVTLNHVSVLYCSAQNNQGGIYLSGGVMTFDNSIVAHCKYDCARNYSGTLTARNSVFTDSSMGAAPASGHSTFVNCVFYDLTTAVRWPSASFENCVFYRATQFVDTSFGTGGLTFKYCAFWNDAGYGPQSCSYAGSNGNIWGNPRFTDAANGDFTLRAGSPCIDAGDGAVAPDTDWYGQPRMDVRSVRDTGVLTTNNVCPDIGIYEYPGVFSGQVPDLRVVAVSAPASATVGDTITVSYTVTNAGTSAASGMMRDTLTLTAEEALGGEVVSAGDVLQTLNLDAGGACILTAQVTVPSVRHGRWCAGVTVNGQTLIYERNTGNNSGTATNATEIALPSLGLGGSAVAVPANGNAGYAFPGSGASEVSVIVTVPTGSSLRVYGASGFIPSSSHYDVQGITLGDGRILLVIPASADGSTPYIGFENAGAGAVSVQVEVGAATFAVLQVSASRISNKGMATLVLTGTGLDAGTRISLKKGAAELQATVATFSSAQISCTFTAEGAATGSYDLVATGSDGSATLPGAVEVFSNGIGPKLTAWLETPASVRDGRMNTAYVCYRNDGDADLRMPVFVVDVMTAGTWLFAAEAGADATNSLRVAGISADDPAGVLRPGYEGRVPVWFRASGAYRLSLKNVAESGTALAGGLFADWTAYLDAVSAAATRLNRRGRAEWRMEAIHRFEVRRLRGQPVCAVSGHLRHAATREALSDCVIRLTGTNGIVAAETKTDAEGYFQLAGLPGEGTFFYSFGHAAFTNEVSVTVTNGCDMNGQIVFATPLGALRGRVAAAGTEEPLDGFTVVASGLGLPQYAAITDSSGRYRMQGMLDGTYEVSVLSSNRYVGAVCGGVAVSALARWTDADFALSRGGRLSGALTADGVALTNATLVATRSADGAEFAVRTSGAGTYCFDGLAAGTYSFAVRGGEWTIADTDTVIVAELDDLTHDLAACGAPIFYALPAGGVAPLTTTFRVNNLELLETARSWSWDLDGDGVEDSTEATPSHTYAAEGSYDVTLTVVTKDGETVVSRGLRLVKVGENVPTVVKDNVVIVTSTSEYAFVSMDGGSLTLSKRVATPAVALAAGCVVVGMTTDETAGFVRRVTAVSEANGRVTLTTEEAGFDEVFTSMSAAHVEYLTADDLVAAGARVAQSNLSTSPRLKGMVLQASSPGEKDSRSATFSLSAGLNVEMSVEHSPAFDFEMRIKPDGGLYLRCVPVSVLTFTESSSFNLAGGVSCGLSKDLIELRKTFTVWAGPVPIVVSPELLLSAGASAELKGTVKMGGQSLTARSALRGGFIYDSGFKPVLEAPMSTSSTVRNIEFEVQGELKGYLNLTSSFWLYGFARIAASAEPYVALDLNFNQWSLSAKRGVAFEAKANIIDLDLFKRLMPESDKLPDFSLGVSKSLDWATVYKVWHAPRPQFTYSGDMPDAPLPAQVSFHDTSTEGDSAITKYWWNFGDGATSSEKNPTHVFAKEGRYTVGLTVYGQVVSVTKPYTKVVMIGKKPEDEPPDPPTVPEDESDGRVVQSCDPNEMAGPTGFGDPETQRYVVPGQWMDYIVYFENVSNATAAAQEVYVDANLSPYLDWSTLELGEVCFNNQIEMELSGKQGGTFTVDQQGTSYQVRVSFSLDRSTGAASWYLRSFDSTTADGWPADAFAGFLPPNDATHRGEGHLAYRVKVRDDALNGAKISASATIVFDQNAAIATDPSWWNTVLTKQTVTFADNTIFAGEGGGASVGAFGGCPTGIASVAYWVLPGTATAGTDYTPPAKQPQRIAWTNEFGEKTITIPIKTDTAVEDAETFYVLLGSPTNCAIGEPKVCKVTITDANSSLTLTEALDNALLKWTTGGTAAWLPQTNVTYDGVDAAASGAVASNKLSYVKTSVTGTGTLSYAWSVAGRGVLRLSDGTRTVAAVTNTTAWATRSIILTQNAAHTLKWEFTNLGGTNSFAYLDQVVWLPGGKTGVAVTATAVPSEGGTASGTGDYYSGAKVPLAVAARPGWLFTGWTPTNLFAKPTLAAQTLAVGGAPVSVTAHFIKVPVVIGLPNPPEGGTVSGSGLCLPGKSVTLKATPTTGWSLTSWSDGSQAATRAISTTTDIMLYAGFKPTSQIPAPTLSNPGAQAAMVGLTYTLALSVVSECLPAVAVSGLPSGLALNATTLVISGVPTKTVTNQTVTVTVKNAGGQTTQSFPMTVAALDARAQGAFTGVVSADSDCGDVVKGLLNATVNAQGAMSAKVTAQSGAVSFTAKSWDSASNGLFLATLKTMKGEVLALTQDVSAAWSAAGLSGGLAGGAFSNVALSVVGQRNPFGAKAADYAAGTNALACYKGYYTVALPPDDVLEEPGAAGNVPLGSGYLALTIKDGGSVTLAGKLADGTAFSGSSTLIVVLDAEKGEAAYVPFLFPLYSAKGAFSGVLEILPGEKVGANVALPSDTFMQVWMYPGKAPAAKPAQTEDRFTLSLGMSGGWYNSLADLWAYYSNAVFAADATAVSNIYAGGAYTTAVGVVESALPDEAVRFDSGSGTLSLPSGKAPVYNAAASNYVYAVTNPAAATFKLTRATGVFTGVFNLYYEYLDQAGALKLKTVSVPHAGMLTPVRAESGNAPAGEGFYLVPDIWKSPDATPVAYPLKRSYGVEIRQDD